MHRQDHPVSQIEFDIEWTERAAKKAEKLVPKGTPLALPPIECMPAEGDVLFLGQGDKKQPFIVVERQYHHEGEDAWTIVLILDLPE
nr:DNA-binding protein [Pandoraea apista]